MDWLPSDDAQEPRDTIALVLFVLTLAFLLMEGS